MSRVLAQGLPPLDQLAAALDIPAAGQPLPGAAPQLQGTAEEHGGVGKEGEEEAGSEGQLDPYLCPPQIQEPVQGHVVCLEVPALPRG